MRTIGYGQLLGQLSQLSANNLGTWVPALGQTSDGNQGKGGALTMVIQASACDECEHHRYIRQSLRRILYALYVWYWPPHRHQCHFFPLSMVVKQMHL
jgi:hypothetical protein